jgi:hydrogenase maturation factor HypF (carbamoyltransferase family)
MPPERRRRIEERTQELLKEIWRREELLKAVADTQREFAVKLEASETAISKLEQQPDMLLKTLSKYVEGLGAELVVSARFPEGDVEIMLGRQ